MANSDLHLNGEYQREPWGYLGMRVRIYCAVKDGSLYAMRSGGVIATAKTMDALTALARRERWVATYRHVRPDGSEIWVSVPE